jgi:hypothetical protein
MFALAVFDKPYMATAQTQSASFPQRDISVSPLGCTTIKILDNIPKLPRLEDTD